MPYSSTGDLPPAVRKLPAHAQRVFKDVFNASYKEHGEESAFKIAWSAVKRAGYGKNKDGKWVKRAQKGDGS